MFENVKFDSIREFVREKIKQEIEENDDKVDGIYFKRPKTHSLVDILKKDEFQSSVDLLNMKNRASLISKEKIHSTSNNLLRASLE
jgi:hypothetical protein